MNAFDILKERGFIKQTVFEDDLYKLMGEKSLTFYAGFDPTADSLHIGHYIPVMACAHLQRHGHKPILLIGGGTAMVGDPTDKTEMRSMMSLETVEHNSLCFKEQMKRFLSFEGENGAIMVNNADWLKGLNYIEFLRDTGVHFSVNKMLTAECFKMRLEKGLSFLEFNYMLMQAYDFLVLFKKYGCRLQLGGNDQWSNILAGADLIRRKEGEDAFCITFPLLLNSNGQKMGKTSKGALWLNREKTSPYDFFQYFRNVEDEKVNECLRLLTFLPMEEIEELTASKDAFKINASKERLAYEVTKIVHSKEDADSALKQAQAAFSGNIEEMEATQIDADLSFLVVDLMVLSGTAGSKGEARRLIEGGGVWIDDIKIGSPFVKLGDITKNNVFVLKKGKKLKMKIMLKS